MAYFIKTKRGELMRIVLGDDVVAFVGSKKSGFEGGNISYNKKKKSRIISA